MIPNEIIDAINQGIISKHKKYLHLPYIDEIRELVNDKIDGENVINLMKSPDSKHRIFGIAICKKLQSDPISGEKIKELLLHIWKHYQDYETRWWTMFRLFEYAELDNKIHQQAYEFVTGEYWDQWLKDCIIHFGGSGNIIPNIVKRPGIMKIAPSKSWGRILQLAGGNDHEAALKIAADIKNNRKNDPFVIEAFDFLEKYIENRGS